MTTTEHQGLSLHIGINHVDPGHYQGWDGRLNACEFDAQDMEALARRAGFATTLLLTEAATRQNVIAALEQAARSLRSGDLFLLTYSGHGGQIPKQPGSGPVLSYDSEATDNQDESWCLYDAQLLDDELDHFYRGFETGVRILLVQDCCHSGFSTFESDDVLAMYAGAGAEPESAQVAEIREKQRRLREAAGAPNAAELPGASAPAALARAMPRAAIDRTYEMNRAFYEGIRAALPRLQSGAGGYETSPGSILAFSACREHELALDGPFNGAFTAALKKVWADGSFSGDYFDFYEKLAGQMQAVSGSGQTPEMYSCATDPVWISMIKSADIVEWAAQAPFQI